MNAAGSARTNDVMRQHSMLPLPFTPQRVSRKAGPVGVYFGTAWSAKSINSRLGAYDFETVEMEEDGESNG